jgi:hypothetical protein
VARAEFFGAVFEETDESPVDVAVAQEAEVVGADGSLLDSVLAGRCEGKMPSRQPARRRRYFAFGWRYVAVGPLGRLTYPITVVCSGLIL